MRRSGNDGTQIGVVFCLTSSWNIDLSNETEWPLEIKLYNDTTTTNYYYYSIITRLYDIVGFKSSISFSIRKHVLERCRFVWCLYITIVNIIIFIVIVYVVIIRVTVWQTLLFRVFDSFSSIKHIVILLRCTSVTFQ